MTLERSEAGAGDADRATAGPNINRACSKDEDGREHLFEGIVGRSTALQRGMAAMRSAAMHRYQLSLVVLSVVVAIAFSSVAARLAFQFGRSHHGLTWLKVSAASLMGLGIASMHYTAMEAAYFMPGPKPLISHTVEISMLGGSGIAMTALFLLGTTLVTMWFHRRYQNERLLQRLYRDLQEREARIRASRR